MSRLLRRAIVIAGLSVSVFVLFFGASGVFDLPIWIAVPLVASACSWAVLLVLDSRREGAQRKRRGGGRRSSGEFESAAGSMTRDFFENHVVDLVVGFLVLGGIVLILSLL